jgi:hypothetical protein
MRRSRVSQLIQMGSIGISDTAPVASPCHPEGALSAQPRAALIERPAGSAVAWTPPLLGSGPTPIVCEGPLRAMSRRCRQTDARARSLSDSLISRNSRSAQSASASSKGRSCRHCSDRRKSQAGRNSASRHRTRNNLGSDRYTKGAGCGAPCAKPRLSGRKLDGCYSVADDSPAGSRSHASVAPAVYEPAQPARRPAAAIGRLQSTETRGAT